ncbi:MAG TPA: DUF1289 domain-containing protein [Rhodocyclaceae bacterium]|nr:DUF1289 domain-containing protein [Rhodocyclaceae bacterium]
MDLPVSPCVRNCCLDTANDVCMGCFRSLSEITAWHDAGREERLAILSRSEERRVAHHRRYGIPFEPRNR